MKKSLSISMILFAMAIAMGNSNLYASGSGAGSPEPAFNMVENGKAYNSITQYMARFVRYPDGVNSFGLIGTVVVEFVVTTNGTLKDLSVINSLSYEIDQEVIKVLSRTSGNWKPATSNGKPVEMKREVSVVFKPNKNYDLQTIALKSREKAREEILVDKNPRKAIKHYDKAIKVLPYELSFFAERGLCRFEAGDVEGAKQDWSRIAYLKQYNPSGFSFEASHLDPSLQGLKGVAQMKQYTN